MDDSVGWPCPYPSRKMSSGSALGDWPAVTSRCSQAFWLLAGSTNADPWQRWEGSARLCLVTQSCLPPWTVAHQAPLSLGILQARILDWVAMPSSRGSSPPRDWTQVSRIAGRFFTNLSHQENSRILEWVAYPFSTGTSWPRNWTRVSCTASRFFICWATREVWWEGYGAITLRLTLGSPPVRIPKVTAPLKGSCLQKFPGGPVVRTFFFFYCQGPGFDLWLGN